MIFIANALPMNGGSTFLVRLCEQLRRSGISVAVLVLFEAESESEEIVSSLKLNADLYYLSEFSFRPLEPLFRSQLGIFLPVRWSLVNDVVSRYGGAVHLMGVFGLFFLARMLKNGSEIRSASVGVYHQNEFMYPDYGWFFSRIASSLFKSLDPKMVLFFNDFNVSKYSQHFGNDYSVSSVVPIGIRVVELDKDPDNFEANNIVSVGNLAPFKTYNEHVIRSLPDLLRLRPNLRYFIYGDGENYYHLKSLASDFGVSDSVVFCGVVDYCNFEKVVGDCFVFVGSGTALLEAAMLGAPALVGIESTKEPITYGFLSEIEGFAYNEDSDRKKFHIGVKLQWLMKSPSNWIHASDACRKKAREFAIDKTAKFFLEEKQDSHFDSIFFRFPTIRVLLSLFFHALAFRVLPTMSSFSERRDVGTDF